MWKYYQLFDTKLRQGHNGDVTTILSLCLALRKILTGYKQNSPVAAGLLQTQKTETVIINQKEVKNYLYP